MRVQRFKEIYIRLEEDEAALIYTVRYAGIFSTSTRLPLEDTREVFREDQVAQFVRADRRLRATDQGGN
jgi:hypothetical protein